MLKAQPPQVDGIAGAAFLTYYGEVNQDSDGPESCWRQRLRRPAARPGRRRVIRGAARRRDDDGRRRYVRAADGPGMEGYFDASG